MATSRRETGLEAWTPPRGRRWSRRDGERMLAALRSSGLSAPRFAAHHSLSVQRVYWWKHQLRGSAGATPADSAGGSRPTFVPVRLVDDAVRSSATGRAGGREPALEIEVGGSAIVRVHRGFDEQLLRRVIETLREAAC